MKLEINQEHLIKLISDFKKDSDGLGQIINPILDNHNLEQKEILEVCQIGKFIYKIDSEIKILQKPKPPNPDFIIEHQKLLIGLEHTQILTEDAKRYFKIKTLIDYAEKIYSSKYPDENVHASISIKNDQLDYKQNEKSDIAKLIADLVYNLKSGNQINLPEFITEIRTTFHSQISFSYDEKNWQSKFLTKARLQQEIQKKEKKINGYKSGDLILTEFWLVLLIGSLNSVSYKLDDNENYETHSKFDRVYLMADFGAKIIRVK